MDLTLGFIGCGSTSKRNASTLLEDLISSSSVRFLLPVTERYWTDGIRDVADYAIEHKIPYEIVHDGAVPKDAKPYLQQARKTTQVTRVPLRIVNLLSTAKSPKLIVFARDEDEELDPEILSALDSAIDKEIEPLDITQGLRGITVDEPEYGPDELDEADDEEEEQEAEPEVTAPESVVTDEQDEVEEEELTTEEDSEAEVFSLEDVEEEPLQFKDEESLVFSPALEESDDRVAAALERIAAAAEQMIGGGQAPLIPLPSPSETAKAEPPKTKSRPPTEPEKPVKTTHGKAVSKAPEGVQKKPMSKAEAQRRLDEYGTRRGRPPADIREARQVLGLI